VSLPKKTTVLRDPVHGDVRLTAEEMAVLDTPQMQRLRGIKQLGAAHLAYPGAVHTRFDHSIGTLHMTGRLIEAIGRNFELDPKSCLGIAPEEARVIRLAALIHDVTHVPYGHNVEDQSGLMERHDAPNRYRAMLSTETALGRVLRDLGVYEDVLGVLLAEGGDGEAAAVPPYWAQLMSDTICSDILDYLARDAYFTGLKLGVDDRLLEHFRVDRQTGNLFIDLSKRNLLREDILSEIVRTLEARYYFSERVYYHHAKVSAGALVARAVELSLRAGTVTPEDLYRQTDDSLLELLERRSALLLARGRRPAPRSGGAPVRPGALRHRARHRRDGLLPFGQDAAQGGPDPRALARRRRAPAPGQLRRARAAAPRPGAQLPRPVEVLRAGRHQRTCAVGQAPGNRRRRVPRGHEHVSGAGVPLGSRTNSTAPGSR
jgi:HD superfamily phosphohydrolase